MVVLDHLHHVNHPRSGSEAASLGYYLEGSFHLLLMHVDYRQADWALKVSDDGVAQVLQSPFSDGGPGVAFHAGCCLLPAAAGAGQWQAGPG